MSALVPPPPPKTPKAPKPAAQLHIEAGPGIELVCCPKCFAVVGCRFTGPSESASWLKTFKDKRMIRVYNLNYRGSTQPVYFDPTLELRETRLDCYACHATLGEKP